MPLPTQNPEDMRPQEWACIYAWQVVKTLQHGDCANHSHTLKCLLCHISTLRPPPFDFFFLHAYHSISLSASNCCISHSVSDSAAARPCDQPCCCPYVCSAPSQQGKALRWWPWRQADYSIPSIAPPLHDRHLPPTCAFATTSWQKSTFFFHFLLCLFFICLTYGSFSPCCSHSNLLSWVLCWQADTNPCDFHTANAKSKRKRDRGSKTAKTTRML